MGRVKTATKLDQRQHWTVKCTVTKIEINQSKPQLKKNPNPDEIFHHFHSCSQTGVSLAAVQCHVSASDCCLDLFLLLYLSNSTEISTNTETAMLSTPALSLVIVLLQCTAMSSTFYRQKTIFEIAGNIEEFYFSIWQLKLPSLLYI